MSEGCQRFYRAVLPAFLLAVPVGQIYAFTNFSTQIADPIGETKGAVQFAFSLGIFFLGMGAAFFGKVVERNIRLSTTIGTALFVSGLLVTSLGISLKSLALIYFGYGFPPHRTWLVGRCDDGELVSAADRFVAPCDQCLLRSRFFGYSRHPCRPLDQHIQDTRSGAFRMGCSRTCRQSGCDSCQ